MGVFEKITVGPYRFLFARSEAERWLEDVLRAATIKQARFIKIRKTADELSLEASVCVCESSSCNVQLRKLDAALHEKALIALMRQKLEVKADAEKPMSCSRGTYEDWILGKDLHIEVNPSSSGQPFSLLLIVDYQE